MNEDIADALCKANVISFGAFKLVSGRESQVYVNLRVLPSYPEIFNFISDKITEIVGNLDVEVLAGTDSAGVALATAVSLKTGLPAIYVRKPRQFTQGSLIDGFLSKGQKVVMVTDLITNGYNKLRLIDSIKNEDGIIENLISVLDKEEGAREKLEKEGIALHSLITLRELMEYMKAHSMIEKEKYNQIIKSMSESQEHESSHKQE